MLNGLVFVLIGLQLPNVLTGLPIVQPIKRVFLEYGTLFCVILITLRVIWMFPPLRQPPVRTHSVRANRKETEASRGLRDRMDWHARSSCDCCGNLIARKARKWRAFSTAGSHHISYVCSNPGNRNDAGVNAAALIRWLGLSGKDGRGR